MWSVFKLRTQLKVKRTASHLAREVLDGKTIRVTAYLISTDVLPSVSYAGSANQINTPQYAGAAYAKAITWTYNIIVTKNCSSSIIKIKEVDVDTLA
jgi:hypothetical protein